MYWRENVMVGNNYIYGGKLNYLCREIIIEFVVIVGVCLRQTQNW